MAGRIIPFRHWIELIKPFLIRPVRGEVLGIFRIIFGLLMSYELFSYIRMDLIRQTFILPDVRLSYSYLDFIQVLPEPVMYGILYICFFAALCILLGLFFRTACLTFAVIYLYILLLDKSLFNNHIYLFILLALLLASTHADKFFSVKQFLRSKSRSTTFIPQWEIFILQVQLAIVYFYGGLAKMNYDWLVRNEPMRTMIAGVSDSHPLAPMVKNDMMVYLLSYGGVAFDLLIPFLLWNKPTRARALIPILFFHLFNSWIFDDIGIFPLVMILSSILFFQANEIPGLRNWIRNTYKQKGKVRKRVFRTFSGLKPVLIGYFIFQLVFPFRGYFLPHHMDWTMIANRFAWRMKIQSKELLEYQFKVIEGPTGTEYPVDVNTLINTQQILATIFDPLALAETARGVAVIAMKQGIRQPRVKVRVRVKWNGYPSAFVVNPEVDLSKVDMDPLSSQEWIMPPPGK
jgi:hypothetical protein